MGGGGSSSSGDTGGPSKKRLNCNLREESDLYNIAPEWRGKFQIGQKYEIILSGSERGVHPLAVTSAKKIIGLLVPVNLEDYIKCIDKRHEYEAEVIEVSATNVRMMIAPKRNKK